MKRFIYRILIALHPPHFHERFGDEMMSVFDESSANRSGQLFADGLLSLARQWLLRSGLWKLAVGAVVSGVVLCLWATGVTQGANASLERDLQVLAGNPAYHRASDALDENEFEREAAQAVSILAEIRKGEQAKQWGAERQSQRREGQPSPRNNSTYTSPNKG